MTSSLHCSAQHSRSPRSSPGSTRSRPDTLPSGVNAMAVTKPAGTWTYEDLLALPDDGKHYEIIAGELYEMPAPNWDHAMTIMNLLLLLAPVVQALGGRLATAP